MVIQPDDLENMAAVEIESFPDRTARKVADPQIVLEEGDCGLTILHDVAAEMLYFHGHYESYAGMEPMSVSVHEFLQGLGLIRSKGETP